MTSDPPPAQVLVSESCSVSVTVVTPVTQGIYDTGFSQQPNQSGQVIWSPGSSNTVSATSVQYSIQTGGASVTLKPGINPKAVAASPGDVASVRYTATISPIVIAAPDPLGRPDLGDGKNQFVYGAQKPDGFLYVPGAIRAVGASHDAINWLIGGNPVVTSSDKVDLKIENTAISGAFTHQWAVSGDTLYVNTPQNTNNPYPQYKFNNWIFKGLPSSNSGFGNHDVNLYVQGTKVQTAKIQSFFDMNANNWTSVDYAVPNWFYYYTKVYTPPQPDIEPVDYNPILGARGQTTIFFPVGSTNPSAFTFDVEVGPTAPDDDIVNVFGIDAKTQFVKRIGGLSIKGIHCFVRVISHEEEHVHLVKQQIVVPYSLQTGPPYGVVDTDGDGIPDAWEKAHHLDPNRSDTTREYQNATGNNAGKGDVECLCDIFAMGELNSHQGLWQQDWGVLDLGNSTYSGLQYGTRPLYFPWQYIDDATYSISTSLPSNALTALP